MLMQAATLNAVRPKNMAVTRNSIDPNAKSEAVTLLPGRYKGTRRRRQPPDPERWECGMCGGKFFSEQAVRYHIARFHPPEPPNPYRVDDGGEAA